MARVLCAGVAVADFVFMVDKMPRSSEKYRAKDAFISGGGNAANAAVSIAKLGGEAMLAARIGADQVGDMILSELREAGVDVSLINRAAKGKSSFSSVYIDRDGERQIMNFRGSGLAAEAGWLGTVPGADAVLVDNRWGPLAARGLEIASKKGIPGVADVEAPIEPEYLTAASHLAFSRQGLNAFAPGKSTTEALRIAHEISGAWTCVTDGEKGVYWFDGTSDGNVRGYPVNVEDTLGAGDVWHAAFAVRLAEGATEIEAASFANAAGALKCTRAGGRSSYPDRKELQRFISENS